MVIRRINSIHRVGGFLEFGGGGSVPFANDDSLTVVFGRNTHGKSTLTEILASLGADDPKLLDPRASIPAQAGTGRLVEISYLGLDGKEHVAKLTTQWTPNELTGHIEVFDEEFVNRNVMAGASMTRENREYLTDFILGEQGVALSNKIEALKREIRQIKGQLQKLRPPFVSAADIKDSEVERFSRMIVIDQASHLLKNKEDLEKDLNRVARASEFLGLSEPPLPTGDIAVAIVGMVQETSVTLVSGHRDVTDAVLGVLQRHIDEHCAESPDALTWMKTGFAMADGSTCPFCGAPKSAGSSDLWSAYGSIFNEEFERHDQTIQRQIEAQSNAFDEINAFNAVAEAQRQFDSIVLYEPFVPELDSDAASLRPVLPRLQVARIY
jgi:wobble nucleotide-excising tRNase